MTTPRPDEWTDDMRAAMRELEQTDAHQPTQGWLDYLAVLAEQRRERWQDDMQQAARPELDPE